MKATTYSVLACNYLSDALKLRQDMSQNVERLVVDAIRHNGEIAPAMVEQLTGWAASLGADGGADAFDVACVMRVKLEAETVYGGFAQVGYKNICKAARLFRDAAKTLEKFEKI